MALLKEVVQEDGVTTNYHRILFIQITTNSHNSIAVLSYVNRESRDRESIKELSSPYKISTTYETNYDETMTIEKAYSFLKKLPIFEGAIDILESDEQ